MSSEDHEDLDEFNEMIRVSGARLFYATDQELLELFNANTHRINKDKYYDGTRDTIGWIQ